MKRRDRTGMSEEDAALWAHVTRSTTRLTLRTQVNRPSGEDANQDTPRPAGRQAPLPSHFLPHSRPELERGPPGETRLPPPSPIEPRKAKRVARGRDEIGARIDLHGMRQVEAHGALRAFLHRAWSSGHRMVLVITGKGREQDVDRHAPFDMFQERDRGILRRNVPRWLSEPELRLIVVGYTTAHVRHGGDGAFYVQLRNPEKFRG